MNGVKLMDKAFYNLDAKEYAKVTNRVAQRSKAYAMELIGMGIKGNVRDKDIIRLANEDLPGMYNEKTGKLTEKGLKEIVDSIRSMFSLNSDEAAKKVTVRQMINRVVKDADSAAKSLNTMA